MKKYGIGSRILTLLLVLALVVSVVPFSALGVNDADDYDDTGLSSGIDTSDKTSISWPIKIYDYLNDGMLFEFAQYNGYMVDEYDDRAAYGGGTAMPAMAYGADYTLGDTYNMYAYKNWGNTDAYKYNWDKNPTEVSRTIKSPVTDENPMYLQLNYEYAVQNGTKSYVWVTNFGRDDNLTSYPTKDEVRYMVMVYRTNETYYEKSNGIGHALRTFWAVSDGTKSGDSWYHTKYNYDNNGNLLDGIDISRVTTLWGWDPDGTGSVTGTGLLMSKEYRVPPSTNEWGVYIVDMKTDYNDTYGLASNWDKSVTSGSSTYTVNNVAGIGMSLPVCAEGETMDISHIAYFSSYAEAEQFGIDAVAFNNDPGEYLGDTYSATYSTEYGPDDSASVTSGTPDVSVNGENFSDGTTWGAPFSSWHSAGNYGTCMKAYEKQDSATNHYYMEVGSWDTYSDSLPFYSNSSGAPKANMRYIAVVYRASNLSSGATTYFNISGSSNGKTASGSANTVSVPNTSGAWSSFVYDLGDNSGYSSVGDITQLYWYLPGLGTSQTIDIAFVDYFTSETTANAFCTAAVGYMNGNTGTAGTTTTTVATKPSPTTSVLDFTIPKGSSGSAASGTTYYSGFNDSTYTYWSVDVSTYGTGGLTTTPSTGADNISYVQLSDDDAYYDAIYAYMAPNETAKANVRYVTIVYKTEGFTSNKSTSFWFETSSDSEGNANAVNKYVGTSNNNIAYINTYYPDRAQTFYRSEDGWTYMTFDLALLSDDSDYSKVTTINNIGWYLPGLTGSEKLDIAFIDFYSSLSDAEAFGLAAMNYMNRKKTTTTTGGSGTAGLTTVYLNSVGCATTDVSLKTSNSRTWNLGDNSAFGMLFASTGGGWTETTGRGGENEWTNGYYTYQVGKTVSYYQSAGLGTNTANSLRPTGLDNKVYLLNLTTGDEDGVYYSAAEKGLSGVTKTTDGWTYDLSKLTADGYGLGYDLFTVMTDGLMTVGLVEPSLSSDGRLVYTEAAVDYIADLLSKTLIIPEIDYTYKNYNYNFVKGTESELYGGTDLATALRNCIGITFSSTANQGTAPTGAMGTYAATAAKGDALIGSFLDVKRNITTFYDAAYYLLNNLFIADSYNQAQDEYHYLTLSQATIDEDGDGDSSNDRSAYVFDAGFTYTDEYGNNLSALVYDKDTQEISLHYETADTEVWKDQYYFSGTQLTTRYPFLPVTDSTGEFAGETVTPYFLDDGVRGVDNKRSTYVDRNYNFVMASNGEFVYHEEDELFFQFEGDDDVYLFINGQLVLDIGAAHSITKVGFDLNDYVEWARGVKAGTTKYKYGDTRTYAQLTDAEKARVDALALEEDQICSFDFYYMERHGWGSNMRIVSNMRVTDPALRVEKTANQNGEDVPYGGVVVAEDPIHYNFKIENTGSTKLYNLTFSDSSIGVALDYTNGLTVADGVNGVYVKDSAGGKLDVTDISAVVTGYEKVDTGGTHKKVGDNYVEATGTEATHKYHENTITFADNAALIAFLKTLSGDGLISGEEDAELTQNGAGLWVDATVTIKGIYYKMKESQVEAGVFDNTVDVTATTKTDPSASASELLHSKASHRVYVSGAPNYYQWAGHNLFITAKELLADASKASGSAGNQLYMYQSFFTKVAQQATASNQSELEQINYVLCDKTGKETTYDEVQITTDETTSRTPGYLVNYEKAGTYSYYVLMSLKGKSVTDLSKLEEGDYAIVRVTIFVADVEDSVFVLDYGLTTENLDANGELFKNDVLFGNSSGNMAAFMGVSLSDPSYLDVAKTTTSDYNRINFSAMDLTGGGTIFGNGESDGYFSVNLPVGQMITYNAYTQTYSLTARGTVPVKAVVPEGWEKGKVYLYYWYDNGAGPDWPGVEMKLESGRTFIYNVPDDVSHIIISNGTLQTENLTMTPGTQTTFTLSVDSNNKVTTTSTTVVQKVNMHVEVPDSWGSSVYLEYLRGNGETGTVQMKKENADDKYYSSDQIPGDITRLTVTNAEENATKKSVDLYAYAGKETWITVQESQEFSYGVTFEGSTYDIHVKAPETWTEVYLYAWDANGDRVGNEWPGTLMEKNENGEYVLSVSTDVTNVIINNGTEQTADLPVYAGRETWLTVAEDKTVTYKYDETGEFTVNAIVPEDWENVYIHYWNNDDTTNDSTVWPGVPMTKGTDGTYTYSVPKWATHVIIVETDGEINEETWEPGVVYQTGNLQVATGRSNTVTIEAESKAYVTYSTGSYTIYASVPDGWGDAYLYYWDAPSKISKDNPDGNNANFPGVAMTKGENGWYSMSGIPSDVSKVIITNSDGTKQTVDLTLNAGMDTWISVTDSTAVQNNTTKNFANLAYGADAKDLGISFTPMDFMDSTYSLYMAVTVHSGGTSPTPLSDGTIDIGNEVQMYKQITVLPANVVYYEDDFPAITYDDPGATVNSFTDVNGYNYTASGYLASEKLTQSVDQSTNYGYDPTYDETADATGSNTNFSGNGLTKVTIRNTAAVASFTFKGTGFELISRTNASDSASMLISVKDSTGTVDKTIPVITEYNNATSVDTANGATGTETIHQVPVIRVDGLTHGTYTVEIKGVPDLMYDPVRGFVKDNNGNYVLDKEMILYIDGLRIFNPLGTDAATSNYNKVALGGANEQGATFAELRNMIVSGTAAVATYVQQTGTQSTVKIYSGNNSWTENHEGKNTSGGAWTTNQVSSVNDYLLYGPNNEVYMKQATADNQAIVFYAKVTDAKKANLQIAVRGIDEDLFSKGIASGVDGSIQLGTYSNSQFSWTDLADVNTGTEMYYTVDLTKCPTFVYQYTDNGTTKTDTYYQIALKVDKGMISYTSLKYNGLELNSFKIGDSAGGEKGTIVVGPIAGGINEIAKSNSALVFLSSIAAQVSGDNAEDNNAPESGDTGSTGSESTGSENTGSESTGSENTGSENTGSENTGSENTGSENTGSENAGSENTGSENTGSENAGSESTGSENTGSESTGSENTGSENTGSENTGSENTGSENAGSENTGSENTGSENTGSENTGSENAGSENTGSENAGSESTGSETTGSEATGSENTDSKTDETNPKTDDIAIFTVVILGLACIAVILGKKFFSVQA